MKKGVAHTIIENRRNYRRVSITSEDERQMWWAMGVLAVITMVAIWLISSP